MRSTQRPLRPQAPIGRRRRFSKDFKRQVVEQTLVRGASVAAIAMSHRLNANQVFTWRRKYLRESAGLAIEPVKMLPVTIEAPSVPLSVRRPSQGSTRRSTSSLARGSIEIEYAGASIRVRGMVDTEALRVTLEVLFAR